ncbi:hypothetical protein F4679DRAFT_555734 [Xylaria curta]|nr:hypothetical protein F4679DRAFT_555734 [Xylaria curta]
MTFYIIYNQLVHNAHSNILNKSSGYPVLVIFLQLRVLPLYFNLFPVSLTMAASPSTSTDELHSLSLAPAVSEVGLLGVLWSGTAFSIVVVLIRVIIRCKLFGKLKVDDYFVLAALTFCLGSTLIWTILGKNLYLALPGAVDLSAITPTEFSELLNKSATGLNANLASYILSYSSLWSIKFSFMAFFKPLGQQLWSQQVLWWISLAFICVGYLVSIALLDFHCLASNGRDVIANCTTKKAASLWNARVGVATSLDIFSDVLIVAVSANIVYRASIPWRKKIILMLICSLTTVMVVAAIIRITVAEHGQKQDISWLLVWNSIEITLGMMTAFCYLKKA